MRRPLAVVAVVTGVLLGISALYRAFNPGNADGYLPQSPSEVLETVPARKTDALSQRIERLQEALRQNPAALDAAVELARLWVEEGRARGDPRMLGYAQAALSPWWELPSPPEEVLLLRATLKQSLHHFEESLQDLDLLLKGNPQNGQAWLTRAVVQTVLGDYAQAEASCQPLFGLAGNLVATVCLTNAQSLHGQAKASYRRLELALRQAPEYLSLSERSWALSTLADAAARAGDLDAAEGYLERAVALDPGSHFLRAAIADLLLDAHRPAEVLTLLGEDRQDDALLLRRVLAEIALGKSSPDSDALRERYQASHQRGDSLHRREEARFVLGVEHDIARALDLARENWKVQREPWDARILLAAALANKSREAAAPVLESLKKNHTEDPVLLGLARQVEVLAQ